MLHYGTRNGWDGYWMVRDWISWMYWEHIKVRDYKSIDLIWQISKTLGQIGSISEIRHPGLIPLFPDHPPCCPNAPPYLYAAGMLTSRLSTDGVAKLSTHIYWFWQFGGTIFNLKDLGVTSLMSNNILVLVIYWSYLEMINLTY